MPSKNVIVLLFFCSLVGTSFGQTFSEVAKSLGIHHSYTAINYGGGVSFYDFNNDGWDDLTLATGAGDSIHFYKNKAGFFEKQTAFAIDTNEIKQILWADVDNDGDQDFFTAVYGGTNYIYINDGSMNFTPVALPNPNNHPTSETFAAAFGDYDVDGDLDLFVTHRVINDSIPNQLFKNDGMGNFADVTAGYFFDAILQPTFGVVFLDYNRDGYPDIYTAEDKNYAQHQCYKNIGFGAFVDQTNSCGAGLLTAGRGLAVGDYNNDNHLDIAMSNDSLGNALFHNNGNETFSDTASYAGLSFYKMSWGNLFLDYDNDRNLDIHTATTVGNNGANKNGLFVNLGNGTFGDATAAIMGFDSTKSFASAMGDVNNDGYPDIAINNVFPDSFNLWLSSGGTNNWLKINLEGTLSNRDGVGSWIDVYAGGQARTYYTSCGTSYLGQNSKIQNIGLAGNLQADSVVVTWLSGIVDRLYNVAANQVVSIQEGLYTGGSMLGTKRDEIAVFPNPFQTEINLSSKTVLKGETNVAVMNSLGQLIYTQKWQTQVQTQLSIDTQKWEVGIYFIQLKTENQNQVVKVVKGA